MAVGVRYYGAGTARPNKDPDDPGPIKTNTQKGGTYLTPAQRALLEEGRVSQVKSGASSDTSTETMSPAEIAAAIAAGLSFNLPGLFPQPVASSGDSGSATLAAKLADLKYNREKDAAETRRKTQGAAASSQMIQDMLAALPTRFQGLGNLIGETGRTNEAYIQNQYEKALGDLTTRRDTGAGLQETGFSAARTALERMQPTAFEAPALALPAAATNQLSQYLSARGVPQQEIQAEVLKVNQASQNAQTNYTGLLSTLSAIERNAAQSRQVENNLAQAVANAQLQTIYGGATSNLEQQKLKSLNDLFNQLQAQRFQLEQAKIAREDALNDSLATLAQAGYPIRGADDATQPPVEETTETATTATTPNPEIAALLQTIAQAQQAGPYTGGGGGIGAILGNEAVMMAKGGVVTKPTLAIIGEDGPEAVVPLTKPAAAKRVTKEARKAMLREKFRR